MPEPVAEERVLREWVAREADAAAAVTDTATASVPELTDALLGAKPGAAAFLWRGQPLRWYRTELDDEDFSSLRPVAGPEDLLWRDVSPDGTIVGVAERLHEDGPEPLETAGIDTDVIRTYRNELSEQSTVDPLIIRTRRGATPWFIADGNHRATAVALRTLETGRYEPQPAYVAKSANPVLGPLFDRIHGTLQRLRGRSLAQRQPSSATRGGPWEDPPDRPVEASQSTDKSASRTE